MANVPLPYNEPVRAYAPGDAARESLVRSLDRMASVRDEIVPVIGGEHLSTGRTVHAVMPHAHAHVLADVHLADAPLALRAVEAARAAAPAWSRMSWESRLAVFLRAADLAAGPMRETLLAATMLGQSKTCHQAEIDAACELVDFWRFNVAFARRIYTEQPASAPGTWNRLDHRPLEGFVLAITPFNFTAIAGNLPTAPAMLGNVVVWKPATSAMPAAWAVMRILEAAGLPPGVVNLVPARGEIASTLVPHPDLAGIHFTGGTGTFQTLWRQVAEHLTRYRAYPRLVGETGGKDFIVAHPSADVDAVATAIVRGGYEYQGQKCSAASRVYVPRSSWPRLRERLLDDIGAIRVGDVRDLGNFMGAVIDQKSFENVGRYQDLAANDPDCTVHAGGTRDGSTGWFVQPTLVEVKDPNHVLMREEIFAPLVTLFVYEDTRWTETLELVDRTGPYALTGAVFARDRVVLDQATDLLRHAAGNFYLNDKPTGAVVGQQPFGGARASGTNDKAGSALNLLRWISPRTIKETFVPPTSWRYPFLG
ncbi:MAG: L-glutamate gamma-semialdehyde dehydrogenase [Deltaproteobacteria bacterium]|nr:L-glutamate gamma-semialdehyde dehydrogenase [Deltaproteobacteria bacterium]